MSASPQQSEQVHPEGADTPRDVGRCTARLVNASSADFDALAIEWQALVQGGRHNQPFLQPYWFKAFADTLNGRREVPIVVVRDEYGLRGVLPLMREDRFFGKLSAPTLRSLSGIHSCRYDFVCSDGSSDVVAEAAWQSLEQDRSWSVIEALNVPSGGAFESLMSQARSDGYLVARWPTLLSPYLTLPTPGDPPFKNCSPRYKSSRKSLERRFRRLSDRGVVTCEAVTQFCEDVFDDFLRIEVSGWKGKAGGAIACNPTLIEFYRQLLQDASRSGHLRISSLKLNDRRIAMEIAFVVDGVYYSPKVAYDEEFAVYSPGHLLVRWIITDAVEQGVLRYDMLGPRARYKCIWASGIREHANCYIIRPSAKGVVYHQFLTRVAPAMRRAKYSLWGDPQAVEGE